MKKIFIPLMISLFLNQNIYASELSNIINKDNKLSFEYEVDKEEKDLFVESLKNETNYEDKNYKLVDYDIKEQDYIDTIEINDTKEIISKSNSLEDILKVLPKTINYDNDGYVGINNLDYENISVTPIYNGYYEEYIDEIKQYFDLTRNDMDFIPKEIEKDGYTLCLINVDWHKQTSKKVGEFELADLYRGEALYRGVKRIYKPYTYRVMAEYKGTANKKITKPYLVNVNYEEIISQVEEKKENSTLPLTVVTTSSIFVILLLIYSSNRVKVYNGKKYIGKYKIKENTIDISKSKNNFDYYSLRFNNRLYKKYKGKTIKILKGDLSKYCQVIDKNIEVKF